MMVLFNPNTRQVVPEQDTDFWAAVAEPPATTVTPVISEEKLKDHCNPAGWAPPDELWPTPSVMVPPGTADPDPMERFMLWPTTVASMTRAANHTRCLDTIDLSADERRLGVGTST